MSKLLEELQMQRDNALATARYFENQIAAIAKPKKKPDKKVMEARESARRSLLKKFGRI